MKKILISLIVLTFILSAKAQTKDTISNNSKADDRVFVRVEKVPEFPGGMEKLYNYLGKNMRYPDRARRDNVQGRVIISFVVERDGSLTGVKVARSLSPETDAEAIRIITKSPKWVPGMQGGRPVRVAYSMPLAFTLTDN